MSRQARSGPNPTEDGPGRLLSPEELRWRVEPGELGFDTTDDVEPLDDVPAQERALEALGVGARIEAAGYNVFCVGLVGADRMETVRRLLCRLPQRVVSAPDRVYVQAFGEPEAPRLLRLPRGTARAFARDVDDLVDQLAKHLALVLEEPQFAARVRAISDEHRRLERDLLGDLHARAHEAGFTVASVESDDGTRIDLLRRIGRHVLALDEIEAAVREASAGEESSLAESPEEAQALGEELAALDMDALRAAQSELAEEVRRVTLEARRLARLFRRKLTTLEKDESLVVVRGLVEELAARQQDAPDARDWLDELQEDVLERLDLFRRDDAETEPGGRRARPEAFARYRVHVVRDNSKRLDCPVVIETNPTPRNLFGTIARDAGERGQSPQCWIRPGSLVDADGGWLVLDATDVISAGSTWVSLKRTLLHGELDLRDSQGERHGQSGSPVLRPAPIPLTTKVVMLGNEETYDYLDSIDQDFRHVFRVRAEFDWLMSRSPENCELVARFVRRLGDTGELPPFDASAVARLCEHAARIAEHPGRLVSRFDLVADAVRQAALVAQRAGAEVVGRDHICEALAQARGRCALGAERLHEAIADGRIMIATTGGRVGQVNALAVRRTIEQAFGHPLRVTAVVSRGTNQGILSIEREVQMSGSLHDKGVYVAQGYLAARYGRETALPFSASVAFEQLYGGIEGDSASSAVIFALLSALADVPIRQAIAVTGSVNQFGEIQAVGGVNEKVEGFYDACVSLAGGAEKLPGDQAVLLPATNVGELMLRIDVVEAVREGRFHVRAISTIDEGIALLTGMPAGDAKTPADADDSTLHGRVLKRLEALAAEEDKGGPAIAQYAEGERGARRQVGP